MGIESPEMQQAKGAPQPMWQGGDHPMSPPPPSSDANSKATGVGVGVGEGTGIGVGKGGQGGKGGQADATGGDSSAKVGNVSGGDSSAKVGNVSAQGGKGGNATGGDASSTSTSKGGTAFSGSESGAVSGSTSGSTAGSSNNFSENTSYKIPLQNIPMGLQSGTTVVECSTQSSVAASSPFGALGWGGSKLDPKCEARADRTLEFQEQVANTNLQFRQRAYDDAQAAAAADAAAAAESAKAAHIDNLVKQACDTSQGMGHLAAESYAAMAKPAAGHALSRAQVDLLRSQGLFTNNIALDSLKLGKVCADSLTTQLGGQGTLDISLPDFGDLKPGKPAPSNPTAKQDTVQIKLEVKGQVKGDCGCDDDKAKKQ